MQKGCKGVLGFFVGLLCMAMVGCGNRQTEEIGENGGESAQSVVVPESIVSENQDAEPVWAGAQFYEGEAVSVWRKVNKAENIAETQDIYLQDSKEIQRLVVDDAPAKYVGEWFLTKEGYCFTTLDNTLVRIEADGKESYAVVAESGVRDICQLEDGRFIIVVKEKSGNYRIAELNPDTGAYKKLESLELENDIRQFVAPYDGGVLLLKKDGFWKVNLESGELTKVMGIADYDFRLEHTIKDFRMLDGGVVELLYQGNSDSLIPKNIEDVRTVITFRLLQSWGWLEALTEEYNKTSSSYYVKFETWDGKSDPYEYIGQFYSELENGTGPDVFLGEMMTEGEILGGNGLWFMENGYLEDLAPFMESSGVYEEDYFPCTFESLRKDGSIYTVSLEIGLNGMKIKEEALGGRAVEDIETFLDTLLNYPTPAVFLKYWSPTHILDYLLCGSEDLWGTIDWENVSCDFQTDLFAKILEVSMLYASDGKEELPELVDFIDSSFYTYKNQEQMRLAKEVYIGYFFDDGVHPVVSDENVLAINVNSKNKEGAWDYIAFLLSEETQTQRNLVNESGKPMTRYCPVNMLAYEEVALLEMEEGAIVSYMVDGEQKKYYKAGSEDFVAMGRDEANYNAIYDLTEEEVEEIREMLYSARNLPKKTVPVLQIVYQESQAYFDQKATLSDTCDAIQKSVQAYLDENCK